MPPYIEKLYFQRFNKWRPDKARSIEQIARDAKRKREQLRTGRQEVTDNQLDGESPVLRIDIVYVVERGNPPGAVHYDRCRVGCRVSAAELFAQ